MFAAAEPHTPTARLIVEQPAAGPRHRNRL